MKFENKQSFAEQLDQDDSLRSFREEFIIPKQNGQEQIYLCGNSLGLQPKTTQHYIQEQLDNWANLAVEGWFEGETPWMTYHQELQKLSAPIVGAHTEEVVPMNTLTVNLHLLLVSFFRPKGRKKKILMEAGAFPSDQYAIESQLRFHGLDPMLDVIEVIPREGEITLRTEDILHQIAKNADELALVLFGGLNYYTGQLYDIEAITKASHEAGVIAGFDLAHAAGNVPLELHQWEVDFACWCTYKYMNSGPGGVSGVFIHERHFETDLPRFAGWWGHDQTTRFKMEKGFIPQKGAQGWQISCSPVLTLAAHKASLKLFEKVGGIEVLRQKSILLTGYLEFIIGEVNSTFRENMFRIITPEDPAFRGAQLSLVARIQGRFIFEELTKANVMSDWREPDVIRISPAPFYNTFTEIFRLGAVLREICTRIPNNNLKSLSSLS